MGKYELVLEAEDDLANIFGYGLEKFGLVQSDRYRDGLLAHFQKIADNPLLYQAVDHIHHEHRRSVYQSHSIYYRITGQGVTILRILGRQGPTKALS